MLTAVSVAVYGCGSLRSYTPLGQSVTGRVATVNSDLGEDHTLCGCHVVNARKGEGGWEVRPAVRNKLS